MPQRLTRLPRSPSSVSGLRASAPTGARDAEVNSYLAAYIMGVANRLANGASNYYRGHFGMGMSEWRTMMAIGTTSNRIIREVAEMADLDYAAASKSLKLLKARGLVQIEQTNRRGRAAIASLTAEGLELHKLLRPCRSLYAGRARAVVVPAAEGRIADWPHERRGTGRRCAKESRRVVGMRLHACANRRPLRRGPRAAPI